MAPNYARKRSGYFSNQCLYATIPIHLCVFRSRRECQRHRSRWIVIHPPHNTVNPPPRFGSAMDIGRPITFAREKTFGSRRGLSPESLCARSTERECQNDNSCLNKG